MPSEVLIFGKGAPPDPWTMMDFEGRECKKYHIVDSEFAMGKQP
jgi:hypothetical protein